VADELQATEITWADRHASFDFDADDAPIWQFNDDVHFPSLPVTKMKERESLVRPGLLLFEFTDDEPHEQPAEMLRTRHPRGSRRGDPDEMGRKSRVGNCKFWPTDDALHKVEAPCRQLAGEKQVLEYKQVRVDR